jgi:hypothetical protein
MPEKTLGLPDALVCRGAPGPVPGANPGSVPAGPRGALISRVGWGGVKHGDLVGCGGGSAGRLFRRVRLPLSWQLSLAVCPNLVLLLRAEPDEFYTGPPRGRPSHTADGLDRTGTTGETEAEEEVGADRRRGNVHRENDPPDPDVRQPPFPDATPSQLVLYREVAGNAG